MPTLTQKGFLSFHTSPFTTPRTTSSITRNRADLCTFTPLENYSIKNIYVCLFYCVRRVSEHGEDLSYRLLVLQMLYTQSRFLSLPNVRVYYTRLCREFVGGVVGGVVGGCGGCFLG